MAILLKPVYLSISSHPENLEYIRRVVADMTSKTSLSKEDAGSIILAVDEACSNIIRHSYQNDYNQKIDLTLELKAKTITISIIDNGIKFDQNLIKPRDINQIKPGGLGVFIIEQIMDIVEYSHTLDGFNKIKLVKKI